MRKFIIREDTIEKIREVMEDCEKRLHNPTAIQWVISVLHDFDTGLCTLSPYMPKHLNVGDDNCSGIFMDIDDSNIVRCNKCGKKIKDAIDNFAITILQRR